MRGFPCSVPEKPRDSPSGRLLALFEFLKPGAVELAEMPGGADPFFWDFGKSNGCQPRSVPV